MRAATYEKLPASIDGSSKRLKWRQEIVAGYCRQLIEKIEALGILEPKLRNRNGQVVIHHTDVYGTDHNQYIYVLLCNHCGQEYGANGSDVWLRKCPYCQGSAPGLPLD